MNNPTPTKTVLISCPVSSREYILPYYLKSIYNLDYPKHLLSIYWIINNSDDQSHSLLKEFKSQYENEYNSIIIEEQNNYNFPKDERVCTNTKKIWIEKGKMKEEIISSKNIRHETYKWLSFLRNKILKKTVSLGVDYLYSSDSDIILKQDSLKRLIAHNKPVVANLLYNGFITAGIEQAHIYPNILKDVTPPSHPKDKEPKPRRYTHITNYKIKNPDRNPLGTLLEVEYSGASILISQDVCKITKYDVNFDFGEDEPWCWSVRQNGYKIYCDISSYQHHAMDQSILDYFIQNKLIE